MVVTTTMVEETLKWTSVQIPTCPWEVTIQQYKVYSPDLQCALFDGVCVTSVIMWKLEIQSPGGRFAVNHYFIIGS